MESTLEALRFYLMTGDLPMGVGDRNEIAARYVKTGTGELALQVAIKGYETITLCLKKKSR